MTKDKMISLKKTLIVQARKERIDSVLEKEHFVVKKKLCSAIGCTHVKACPFYRDPEDYERKLIKDKLSTTHCTYWSNCPDILEKLDYIKTGKILSIAKKTSAKKIPTVIKTLVKKDLQKQLLSFDKVLNEISERWNVQI